MKRRSNGVGGHKTSFSIEDIFWASGREIVRQRATIIGTYRPARRRSRSWQPLFDRPRLRSRSFIATMANPQRNREPHFASSARRYGASAVNFASTS
jgi:hypothetical protein